MANKNKNTTPNNSAETVEVLYQKMGDRWFAFSLIDEEVFVGSITQDEIDGNGILLAAEPTPGNAPGMTKNS